MDGVDGGAPRTAPWERGYVQVYTGDGKGKTTAAMGLLVRAAGAGLHVYFGQFLKAGTYSEIKALTARFPEVCVKQFGHGRFICGKPTAEAMVAAARGLGKVRDAVVSGRYDLVIADELMTAIAVGLLAAEDAISLIDAKPPAMELVLTGRGAPREVIVRADLVTEMRAVKHYFANGVKARVGIEK